MNSPILDSIKKHTSKFLKKMKWWLLLFFLLFGMNGLVGSMGSFEIFLYKFIPSFVGGTIALIIVYFIKYRDK